MYDKLYCCLKMILNFSIIPKNANRMSQIFALIEIKKCVCPDGNESFEINSIVYASKEEIWKQAWEKIRLGLRNSLILPMVAHPLFEPVFKAIAFNSKGLIIEGNAIDFFINFPNAQARKEYFENREKVFHYICMDEVQLGMQFTNKYRNAPGLEAILEAFACATCSCEHYEDIEGTRTHKCYEKFGNMKPTELQKEIIKLSFEEKKRWKVLKEVDKGIMPLLELDKKTRTELNAVRRDTDLNDSEKKARIDAITRKYQSSKDLLEEVKRITRRGYGSMFSVLEAEYEKIEVEIKESLKLRGGSLFYYQLDILEEVFSGVLLIERLRQAGFDVSELEAEKRVLQKKRNDNICEQIKMLE